MKKSNTSLFSELLGIKPKHKTIPIAINQYSQPHVLQQRMKEAKLTHGETIKGDIGPVRLEGYSQRMVLYFCAAQEVTINEKITPGDGGSIPSDLILKGFNDIITTQTKPGLYMLKNATLFSNGTMQVIAGEDTVFEAI